MKTLVITEKSNSGKDMAIGLGVNTEGRAGYFESDRFIVTWASGHLVTLNSPEMYDASYKKWSLAQLPIVPERFQYHIPSRCKAQFETIKSLIHRDDVDRIVIATDAGREGELVGRLILDKAGNKKEVFRFWTSSAWTPDSVQEGFRSIRPLKAFDALYFAALGRQQADWLVGINASRAISVRANMPGETHSLGRVKTPTLGMIVGRQMAVEAFDPTNYYTIKARFVFESSKQEYLAGWVGSAMLELPEQDEEEELTDDQKGQHIFEENVANKIVNRVLPHRKVVEKKSRSTHIIPCDGPEGPPVGKIVNVKESIKKTTPPCLFSLTTLQQEANRIYGFSLDETDRIAQQLYQKHKAISYPRAESEVLGLDMYGEVVRIINALYESGHRFDPAKTNVEMDNKRIFNDIKLVEDHHAIIPNGHQALKMDDDERKIYRLIVKRFLAAFYPPYAYSSLQVLTLIENELFKTTRSVVTDGGWKEYYNEGLTFTGGKDQVEGLERGDSVRLKFLFIHKGKTSPPPAYNDASLVHDMTHAAKFVEDPKLKAILRKSHGIGTVATRSHIVSSLIDKGYVHREGKNLYPTPKARALISALGGELIANPGWTAYWEDRLDKIARKAGGNFKDFMGEITQQVRHIVDEARTISAEALEYGDPLGVCPECRSADVWEKENRCVCRQYPKCKFTLWKDTLSRMGKSEVTRSEVEDLLKGEEIPLEQLRNKSNKLFDAVGRLTKHEKYGWQIKIIARGMSMPKQEKEVPEALMERAKQEAVHCGCTPIDIKKVSRPHVHDTAVLAMAAGIFIKELNLEQSQQTKIMSILKTTAEPLTREVVGRELRTSGVTQQKLPDEFPDPRLIMKRAYQKACELWVFVNKYTPRFVTQQEVLVGQDNHKICGWVTEIHEDEGYYLIETEAISSRERLLPWEGVYCPSCRQPGIVKLN